MRKIFILMILLGIVSLSASTVATVGSHKITYAMLSETMEEYNDRQDLSLSQIRKLALNKLIEEQLLLIYAKQENITIDDDELDAFFIKELGSHSKFITNALFDYNKYADFKGTDTGRKILEEMNHALLIAKTEDLVHRSLFISDEELLQNYIKENTRIDLSYAVIDVNKANVNEDFTSAAAMDYYKNHKRNFKADQKIRFEFFIIPFAEFQEEAELYYNNLFSTIAVSDSENVDVATDSLKTEFIIREINKRSFERAVEISSLWSNNQQIPYDIIATPLISSATVLGKLSHVVIETAIKTRKNEISQPVEIDIGYLVLHLLEIREPRISDLSEIKDKVWDEYVSYEKSERYSRDYRRYFIDNIDDFIISAAVVKKIVINSPWYIFSQQKEKYEKELKKILEENRHQDHELDNICRENNLEYYNQIIYLEKFKNDEVVDSKIAALINKGNNFGFIKEEKRTYFYNVTTLFPEFIPNFKDIESDIHDLIYLDQLQNSDFTAYYEEHKKDFITPDSLQLSGGIFEINIDSVYVSPVKMHDFYTNNINSFYREAAVILDYFFTKDQDLALTALELLNNNTDLELVQYCFGNDINLPRNKEIYYTDFPTELRKNIEKQPARNYSDIIPYRNGYLIIYKIKNFPAGLRNFYDVEAEITYKFKYELADSIAYAKAQTLFDSTRYYSQSFEFTTKEQRFQTSFLPVNNEFEILGKLGDYRNDLLRIWKNEKFSRIIEIENGYTVIYLTKRVYSRKMEIDEALPKIKDMMAGKNRYKTAKKYAEHLRDLIKAGRDPDSLLYFQSGLHRAFDQDLESQIFGPDLSELIMNDISKREEGYYSPVINLSEEKLMFYLVNSIKKVSYTDFQRDKTRYRENILQYRYQLWLEQMKSRNEIKIRI